MNLPYSNAYSSGYLNIYPDEKEEYKHKDIKLKMSGA